MSLKTKNTKSIEHVLDVMHDMFRDFPMTELQYETPFQCLVAVMLSAQTTDKQVNKVTETLFQKIKAPCDVVAMGVDRFGKSIMSIGLWSGKAKNIVATARHLLQIAEQFPQKHILPKKASIKHHVRGDGHRYYKSSADMFVDHGYVIPATLDELTKLPGVGIKTAKVVLYVLYGQRHVAVDTHVHRVMNRLGVVSTKSPEQTSNQLETLIPDSYKDIAHKTIIYFGRYLCTAKKPQCATCPLRTVCAFYRHSLSTHEK